MNKLIALFLFLPMLAFGQQSSTVMALTNGVIKSPLKLFQANIFGGNGVTVTPTNNGVNSGGVVISVVTGGAFIGSSNGIGTNITFWSNSVFRGPIDAQQGLNVAGDFLTVNNGEILNGGLAVTGGAIILGGTEVRTGTISGNGGGITNLAPGFTNATHIGLAGTENGLATISAGFAIGITNESRTNVAIAVHPGDIPLYSLQAVGPAFASLNDGDVLTWDAASSHWTNKVVTAAAVTATNAIQTINGMTNYNQYIEATPNSNWVNVSFLQGTNRINIPVADATHSGIITSNLYTNFNARVTQGQLTSSSNALVTYAGTFTDGGAELDVPFADAAGGLQYDTLLFFYDTGTGGLNSPGFVGGFYQGANFQGNIFTGGNFIAPSGLGTFAGDGSGITNLPTALTNATHRDIRAGKYGLKTWTPGNGILITNVGGTNLSPAIDPAVVASQFNLFSASNAVLTLTFDSASVGQVPYYAGANAFAYDSRFTWNAALGMISALRLQMASNSLTVPIASDLGVGGSRLWNSNGTIWVSCSTNGTTLFNQQIDPIVLPAPAGVARTIHIDTTHAETTVGGFPLQTLVTWTMPANTMVSDGDRIKVRFSGGCNSTANTERDVGVLFGGTEHLITGLPADVYFVWEIEAIRSDSTHQVVNFSGFDGKIMTSTNNVFPKAVEGAGNAMNAGIVIALEATAYHPPVGDPEVGGVFISSMSVEYWPAP